MFQLAACLSLSYQPLAGSLSENLHHLQAFDNLKTPCMNRWAQHGLTWHLLQHMQCHCLGALMQVEVYKYTGDAALDDSAGSAPAVVRACITKVPPGYSRIEVAAMEDAIWGLDGFDT